MAGSTAVIDVDRTLVDHFERQGARVPDRVAAGDAVRTFTYAEPRPGREPHRPGRDMIDPSRARGGSEVTA